MENQPLDLAPIKSRLMDAGYAHPSPDQPSRAIRDVSREGQRAREVLREHIIDDVWALIDEVELLRGKVSS